MFFLVIVVWVGLASPLDSHAQATNPNPLDSLAWMVGGKWTAAGDKGPDGKPFQVECKLSWAENHRGIRFTTWFLIDGKQVPVFEGMYAWHPAKKKFAFFYTDNEGNLTEGGPPWPATTWSRNSKLPRPMEPHTHFDRQSCAPDRTITIGTFNTRTKTASGLSFSG
jgi:hypothetical protein